MNDNNSYSHDYNQASEYLRLVLPFLSKHKIPASPLNYHISYDYVSGSYRALKKAVDELINQSDELTEQDLSDLYKQYIVQDDRTLESIRHALHEAIISMQKNYDSSSEGLSDYLDSLNTFSKILANTDDPSGLVQEVQTVMKDTRSTEKSQRYFEAQISSMMLEVETLRDQLEKAREESLVDPLTGLANRKAFNQMLSRLIDNTDDPKSPFSLVIGDIDHFKNFNDTYGHLVGDRVLSYVGKTINTCIKGKDLAARFGGEEFVMLLPETDLQGAYIVAEQIRSEISRNTLKNNSQQKDYGKITISLGVGQYQPGEAPDQLLERADKALYQAKENGRNRVEKAN